MLTKCCFSFQGHCNVHLTNFTYETGAEFHKKNCQIYIIYKVNSILIVVVAKSTRRPASPAAWSASVSGGGVGGGAGGGGQAHVGHVTVM